MLVLALDHTRRNILNPKAGADSCFAMTELCPGSVALQRGIHIKHITPYPCHNGDNAMIFEIPSLEIKALKACIKYK
jgi:hypothetical protein